MRRCPTCNLIFFSSTCDINPIQLFTSAYLGQLKEGGMKDFYLRLRTQNLVYSGILKLSKMLSRAHLEACRFIEINLPKSSTIFEIGCGVGYFLTFMKQKGYQVAGLEVSAPCVHILQKEGYKIWHGTIESLPKGWIEPDIITCFFVLHHLQNPINFFVNVREKFPSSPILVATYDTKEIPKHPPNTWFPPRTYLWLNKKSLTLAMERSGYKAHILSQGKLSSTLISSRTCMRLHDSFHVCTWIISTIYYRYRNFLERFIPKHLQMPTYYILALGIPKI
jgi:hypothetical protein